MNGEPLVTSMNYFRTSKLLKTPVNNFIKSHALSHTVIEITLL